MTSLYIWILILLALWAVAEAVWAVTRAIQNAPLVEDDNGGDFEAYVAEMNRQRIANAPWNKNRE